MVPRVDQDADRAVTVRQVARMGHDETVDARNGDDHEVVDPPSNDPTTGLLANARNAIETAELLGIPGKSGGAIVQASQCGEEATDDANGAEREHDETPTTMTEEREELLSLREKIDDELSEIGAAIEELQAELSAIDEDVAAAIETRDAATEAFLPADRLPQSISTDTRGAVASYLDTLAEKLDVRSEQVVKKSAEQDVERKKAGNARDDIDEIGAAIDRLVERTAEAKSRMEQAREVLEDTRSKFTDDLTFLATQFESFDIHLTEETLDEVIDERIPARNTALLTSIESVSRRIAELSTKKSTLEDERDKLQSIEGGGTCPTCNQNVGQDRTGAEVQAIEEDLHEVERQLGAAEQEREELIRRRDELSHLRDEAISLRSFRSETVAQAAGRLEDRRGDYEDLEADLEEERAGLAASIRERDDADAAIDTLATEIDSIEADIDQLEDTIETGENSLESFGVVDELRAQLEGRTGELSDLQETYEEKEVERAALDDEIDTLPE